MKRAAYVVTVLMVFAGVSVLSGHGAEPRKVSEIMRQKLKNAQTVLEGISLNDFKKINKSAEDLLLLTKEEGWKVLSTRDYEYYSNEFRRRTQTLMKNAKDKNLDACALSYVELTLTCVKCHKHVREVRMGMLPPLTRQPRLAER
jgi:hypothetical protein